MSRINVYARGEDAQYMEHQGKSTLIGWFNDDTCTDNIYEGTRWNGNNHVGVISGLQCGHEDLRRTKQGRWVRHYDSTREFNGPEFYEFLTDAEAKDWLMRAETEKAEEALEKYFGEVEEESGPNVGGRPEVGPPVSVRFPKDMLERIDVARGKQSRAEWLRTAAEAALLAEATR
ncbi:hypothetical protein ACWEO1_22485 [Kitasatospora cineracea]